MKTTNLEHLMQKYITGQVTEQEKKKIEAWLDVKKTDEGTDMVLDAEDEERLFRKITASIDNVEEIKSFRPGKGRTRALFSTAWFRIAASLLIVAAVSYTLWVIAAKDTVHETITRDNTEKVILDDGSIVWLREQSRLTFVNKRASREATLSGEGLFEVAKEPSRPFIISCVGGSIVKVTGTSFNLKSGQEGVELKVLTGRVSLSSNALREGVDVAPNEMAVYDNTGDIRKKAMAMEDARAITARTEYDMAFRNTTLEMVIGRIEKKFNVRVDVENPRAKACRITADFTDRSLDSTLSTIAELLEIDYIIKRGTVTVTGEGCH